MQFPTFDLSGKVALVTGSTKGIGYGLAMGLANAGADIVVVSRTPADCDKTCEEIKAMGRDALAVPTDITDYDGVQQMVDKAMGYFGKIDILVNNAGTAITKRAEDITMKDWDRVLNIDLRAAFMVAQAVGKVMIKQQGGRIINIVSVYGYGGAKLVLPYLAAKGGLAQMTNGLAMEWAKHNINVNSFAPGYIITPMNQQELEDKRIYDSIVSKIPLRRLGTVSEMIGGVVFLASDAANYVTGAVLAADGGWMCN